VRNGLKPRPSKQAPRALKNERIIQGLAALHFDNVREPNNERILNRAGFYKTDDAGFRVYMVLPEVFKSELCKGFESRMVTRLLINAGWLAPAPDGSASHKPRIKGVGTPRLYVFTDKIWSDD
jgi:hypothetical protein